MAAPFDLRQFEKIDEDEKTATLKHPKGHTIVIAIKALPKIQQEAIRRLKLSKGGGISEQGRDVRYAQKREGQEKEMAQDFAKEEARGRAKFERERVKPKIKGLAEGGEVKPKGNEFEENLNKKIFPKFKDPELAKKGWEEMKHRGNALSEKRKHFFEDPDLIETENPPSNNPKDIFSDKQRQEFQKELNNTADEVNAGQAEEDKHGADAQASAPPPAEEKQAPQSSAPIVNVFNGQPPQQQMPATAQSGTAPPSNLPNFEAVKTPAMPEQIIKPEDIANPAFVAPSGTGAQQEARRTMNAANAEEAGIKGQAQIDTATAPYKAQNTQEYIENQKNILAQTNKALQFIYNEADALKRDTNNGNINPMHYQEEMGKKGIASRVANAMGLFAGGLGVPFGGHNFAFDFLNKQIDRDIQAQQKSFENRNTIYGAYERLFGHSKVTADLARATTLDIYSKNMEEIANRTGTAQAKVNAGMAIGKWGKESDELRQGAAAMLGHKYGNQSGFQKPNDAQQNGVQIKKNNDWFENHILAPDAEEISDTLQWNKKAKPFLTGIQSQKEKAALADKALATIEDRFSKLVENRGTLGQGYLRRKGHLLGSVPYIGPIVESGTNFVTDTNQNSAYDTDYQDVVGAVRGALQGNVSDDLLDNAVRVNAPEQNDPPEILKKKLSNLKSFIRSHTKTDLLKQFKLSKE